METLPPPSTADDLVDFIGKFVRDNHARTGRNTDGAYLAKAIHFQFPGFRLQNVGVSRLADAVSLAEQKGLVVRNRAVQHLEVRPADQMPSNDGQVRPRRLPRVRPEIWKAVVFVSHKGPLRVNRITGFLSSVPQENESEDGETAGSQGDWVKLEPIATDTQKKWMYSFVSGQPGLAIEDAPTDEERWWEAFSRWLRERSLEAEFAWRRYRTQRVVEYLQDWAQQHNVPLRYVFAGTRTSAAGGPTEGSETDEEATRKALLAAISEMPLEQLEQLAIPARYVLRHFTVR